MLVGGDGADAIVLGGGLFGGDGDDLLDGGNGEDDLVGGPGNDVLCGGDGNDVLRGGLGNDVWWRELDTMNGGAGDDTLIGGLGDDLLVGGDGIDTASYQDATGGVTANLTTGVSAGDRGADTFSSIENLTGGAFNDQLDGNGGANVLNGGAGLDNLFGRGGDDTLIGGLGNDFLAGGDGIDTASYSDATGNVEANLTTGVSAGNRGADEYLSIENLTGGVRLLRTISPTSAASAAPTALHDQL